MPRRACHSGRLAKLYSTVVSITTSTPERTPQKPTPVFTAESRAAPSRRAPHWLGPTPVLVARSHPKRAIEAHAEQASAELTAVTGAPASAPKTWAHCAVLAQNAEHDWEV